MTIGNLPPKILKITRKYSERIEEEQNSTMLYDPVENDYRTYAHCKMNYGQDLADKMLRC